MENALSFHSGSGPSLLDAGKGSFEPGTIGSQLVDQGAWYTVAYWDWGAAANWTQSGTTLVSDGNTGNNGRNNFWTIGKQYSITITVILNSGSLVPCYDGVVAAPAIASSGTYTYEYTTTKDEMWIRSINF